MKMCNYTKSIVFFFALLAVSCSMQEKDFKDSRENPGKVFYASIEVPVGEAETKVYADDDLSVLWHEDDRVSIFNKNTYNQEYRFTGKTGSNAGSFEKVTSGGFVTGNPLSSVYSVYPYSASTEISNQGLISVDLPSTQTYAQHSFGPKANTMVSVSSDEMLLFKNVGGYLVLRLYGEDVEVSSITLKGNNDEKLAGKAAVSIFSGGNPSVEMNSDAAKEITLTCDNPVTIGNTAAGYTEFWFVTPPVSFSKGITIRVNGPNGSYFEKSSSKAISIGRNTVSRMAAIEVELSGGEDGFVVFKDDNFKAYCVENFDTDGNGEISFKEASVIDTIRVNTDNIYSVQGIEHMSNLVYLNCSGSLINKVGQGKLIGLDVSNNTGLKFLACSGNQLTSLDVSKNTALTSLRCGYNQLTTLDAHDNTSLTFLHCSYNKLTKLTGVNNSALVYLYCHYNQLTSVDVSNNIALVEMDCESNQLTSLNVSNNTKLLVLWCDSNLLPALDVSSCSALHQLECTDNQLTSLDVSKNYEFNVLKCTGNPNLIELWLRDGQTIHILKYDSNITTIKYRGIDDVTAIDLGLSVKWASCNLGAEKPEDYGDYYAWGETEPKSDYSWSTYKWGSSSFNLTKYNTKSTCGAVDNKTVLNPEDDVVHGKLGGDWRMPTYAEWTELLTNCTWTWTTNHNESGISGIIVTGHNGNSIFFPAAGYRDDTNLLDAGSAGGYWSSSLTTGEPDYAGSVGFYSTDFNGGFSRRYFGRSVRPVKE